MSTTRQPEPPRLIGRDTELGRLRTAVEEARAGHGSAILVTGEAGIGKTSLLQATAQAGADGFRVLTARGVGGTRAAGFEGLHELLVPVLSRLDNLPRRQGAALKVAFGMEDGEPADRLITGIATFSLLEDASVIEPLLVLVEDLHWLDEPTAQTIAFLASRLSSAAILLVASSRSDAAYQDWQPYFPDVLTLEPLTEEASEKLLTQRAPQLARRERTTILRQSLGNPLALTELSATPASASSPSVEGTSRLAVTRRLERAFLAETALLPETSQRAVLVAALGEGSSYGEILSAGAELGLEHHDFVAAERTGLLRHQDDTYQLRHPLVGSALIGNADSITMTAVHAALARTSTDRTRSARHLAAATTGPDEEVASELEAVALELSRRGARAESAEAWRQSASLTLNTHDRGRRLVQAAEAAREAGASELCADLIRSARPLIGADENLLVDLSRTDWLLTGTAAYDGLSASDLLASAPRISRICDRVQMLVWAAVKCYLGQEQSPQVRHDVAGALDATATEPDTREHIYRQIGLQLTDPTRNIEDIDVALAVLQGEADESARMLMTTLAFAAEDSTDLAAAEKVWTAGADLSRRTSRPGDEVIFISGRGTVRVTATAVSQGLTDSEQALRVSTDLGLTVVTALAAANISRARAWRGETERARAALETSTTVARGTAIPRVVAIQHWARGMIAANEGRFEEALDALLQTSVDPSIALWAGADLAEPAAKSQRPDSVESWLTTATHRAEETGSPHLAMLVDRTHALLATDDARLRFESALRHGELSDANLELARTRLYYGEWLRRERRLIEARAQLLAAARVFRSESALALAERASRELRAAGGIVERPTTDRDSARDLTGQELIVVQLAAQGLSNKEIADQIYLSHRTVQAHLHRAFTKLGVTRRSQLAAALTAE
ncbi:AAA family ATPase [Cellulosimicrobium cellulans]|uniref:AAA family ATPase n=1 Tax=Cellulosimicrobium cellulans TaxID=1710 RepID=UPI0037FFBB83